MSEQPFEDFLIAQVMTLLDHLHKEMDRSTAYLEMACDLNDKNQMLRNRLEDEGLEQEAEEHGD